MSVLPSSFAALPRHRAAVEGVLDAVTRDPDVAGVILCGSFAAGTADALSDLDLLVVVANGSFDKVWTHRALLHGTTLHAWDVFPGDRAVGAHKWLTSDLVLVECLIAEPSSGVRLADPFECLAGPSDLPDRLIRRDPIPRGEVDGGGFVGDPVELLYDALKRCVRGDAAAARRLVDEFMDRSASG